MSKVLIDTNIYCDAMRGITRAVKIFRTSTTILISPIVIGELLSGFRIGRKEEENREQFTLFLLKPKVNSISITKYTAEFYSMIFDSLKKSGTPIPAHDIWIAASALEHGAKLATNDDHFKYVHGIFLI